MELVWVSYSLPKQRVIVLVKWSYRTPRLCWLLNLEWLSYPIVQFFSNTTCRFDKRSWSHTLLRICDTSLQLVWKCVCCMPLFVDGVSKGLNSWWMDHAHLHLPLINCGKIIIMKNHVDNLPFHSCSQVDESNWSLARGLAYPNTQEIRRDPIRLTTLV